MAMSASGGNFLKLSARDFPDRDRIEAVRELYGKSIIKVDLQPLPDHPFQFDARLHALPGIKFACGTLSPVRGILTKELADGDDLLFNVPIGGSRTACQGGREMEVGAGHGALTTSTDPGVVTVHSTSRFISFRAPRKTLQPMISNLDAALTRTVSPDREALRLLIGYAGLVDQSPAISNPETRSLVAAHFQDLIALALGAEGDAAEMARKRGLRAARLRAIKNDVLAHLTQADLSLVGLATRHGISPRYISLLFAGEGTSFTDFTLNSRLERAHRMLRSSSHADRPISEIAFACGFGDLSYFNRTFRRRYAATPSDVRAGAPHDGL
jgi:AraC-like DNA-binding protein